MVLAHVDSKAGPDVFARLRELRPGDRVLVHREDGSATFTVDSLEQVGKDQTPFTTGSGQRPPHRYCG